NPGQAGPPGNWTLSLHRYERVVSKNSDDWSTHDNVFIIRFPPDRTLDQVEVQRAMLINNDPPDHTKMRGIVSRGFTPRAIGAMHDLLRERAYCIVEAAKQSGSGDFVEQVAAELPLQAIADLLGVPRSEEHTSE